MEATDARSEVIAVHDASSAAHALAGMYKAQSSPAIKHSFHLATAASSSAAALPAAAYVDASASTSTPLPRPTQGGSVTAGSLLPPQWHHGKEFRPHQQQQQQQSGMHMTGQPGYPSQMLHNSAQMYGSTIVPQQVAVHQAPPQSYCPPQQHPGAIHAGMTVPTSAGYSTATGYASSALSGGYHMPTSAVTGQQQHAQAVSAQHSYMVAPQQHQQFAQHHTQQLLPASQRPGHGMPSSAHHQPSYGQYQQHPYGRMPPSSPYTDVASSSSSSSASASVTVSSSSLSQASAPQYQREASRDSTHTPSGRRATAVAAQHIIATSLESVSGAASTGGLSSSVASASALASASGPPSEMLSLLDSRTVDVRVRGIVALAEQEAASRLQQAHPDTDDDEAGSARKRKGPTDRASRRRELNRVNAKKSRLRKKFFIEALILRVAELEKETERLKESLTEAKSSTSSTTSSSAKAGFGSNDAEPAIAATVASGSDSTAATLSVAARTDHASRCSGDSSGQAQSGRGSTRSASSASPGDATSGGGLLSVHRTRSSDVGAHSKPAAGNTSTSGTSGTLLEEDSTEEDDGMPSPPGADAISSASAPRVIAAEALTPQMRDALVASGPDWDLVRWMDSSNQAFCIADPSSPDMPLAYVSPGFEVLTGYESREVIGRNCRFLQGPGTDPAARRRMAKALRAGSGCVEVVLNYRKDGAPFWNRVLIAPLRDATGAVRSYVSVQSCVTKSLTALTGLARPQADGVTAPAPPPSLQAAMTFSIVSGQPSSFSAVQPPQARIPHATVTHNPEAAFAAAAEAHAAAVSRSHKAKSDDAAAAAAADDDDDEDDDEKAVDVSALHVTSRAAGHGPAISDADAAMLISQISQTDAAVVVKRERDIGESSAVEPAGTRARQ